MHIPDWDKNIFDQDKNIPEKAGMSKKKIIPYIRDASQLHK